MVITRMTKCFSRNMINKFPWYSNLLRNMQCYIPFPLSRTRSEDGGWRKTRCRKFTHGTAYILYDNNVPVFDDVLQFHSFVVPLSHSTQNRHRNSQSCFCYNYWIIPRFEPILACLIPDEFIQRELSAPNHHVLLFDAPREFIKIGREFCGLRNIRFCVSC